GHEDARLRGFPAAHPPLREKADRPARPADYLLPPELRHRVADGPPRLHPLDDRGRVLEARSVTEGHVPALVDHGAILDVKEAPDLLVPEEAGLDPHAVVRFLQGFPRPINRP